MTTTRAVILARGLGTRMRKADSDAPLDPAQAAAADSGIKGMIPIGRPFMDYLISALADAGFSEVCLVIGPEHDVVRRYYGEEIIPTRVRIQFAVQEKPRGTADAVLAAEAFADGESFAVINSDNYYPVEALAELHRRNTPALIAFHRESLATLGNVAVEKLARFGALEIDEAGNLRGIVATPGKGGTAGADPSTSLGMTPGSLGMTPGSLGMTPGSLGMTPGSLGMTPGSLGMTPGSLGMTPGSLGMTPGSLGQTSEVYASLNCWLFTSEIFRACRAVPPSARGELELPQAVMLAIAERWMAFEAVRVRAGVLDMSSRGDVASVAARLSGTGVHL